MLEAGKEYKEQDGIVWTVIGRNVRDDGWVVESQNSALNMVDDDGRFRGSSYRMLIHKQKLPLDREGLEKLLRERPLLRGKKLNNIFNLSGLLTNNTTLLANGSAYTAEALMENWERLDGKPLYREE